MGPVKPFAKTLFIILILFAALQNKGFADGGFPVRPGRLLISPSVSYFFATQQWDSTGVKKPFPNGGKYTSIGITFYSEYGISRRFAAVVTLPYVYNNYMQNIAPTNNVSNGLTDMETGIRYYLANISFIYYFSLQASAITPLYGNNPRLGYGEEGAELKFAISGSGHLGKLGTYFNVYDGIRQYFGNNGPIQNRWSGTFGLSLDKRFANQVSVGLSGINSWSNDKNFISALPETNKDFSFIQASLSYGHSFSRELALFVSGGEFLTGRNTGVGNTASVALIYRLDYH